MMASQDHTAPDCPCPPCSGERATFCALTRSAEDHQNHHAPGCPGAEKDHLDDSGACRVCGGLLAHATDCSNLGLSAEDEFLMTYGEGAYRAALGLNGDER